MKAFAFLASTFRVEPSSANLVARLPATNSAPHATQLGPDVEWLSIGCGLAAGAWLGQRPRIRNAASSPQGRREARARGVDVAITASAVRSFSKSAAAQKAASIPEGATRHRLLRLKLEPSTDFPTLSG